MTTHCRRDEEVTMTATLHYIYDPLCGWCYGAEPLVNAAAGVPTLVLELHAGALFPQPTQLAAEMRRYIQQADRRVGELTGQPYGEAYLNGLLLDPSLVLDSPPTIAAVLAAQALNPAQALPMLRGIQHAHWEHGRRVVDRDVLCDVAADVGLDRAQFAATLDSVEPDEHIAQTRKLMEHVGAGGFPTFVLQLEDRLSPVPHQRFAAAPAQFGRWLEGQIAASPARRIH
jgi:putative protein-disulfide isomerase